MSSLLQKEGAEARAQGEPQTGPGGKREVREDSTEVQLERERYLGSENCSVVGVQERIPRRQ